MNQEAGDPLPCPVPSPSAVGMLGRSESPGGRQRFPWARSAYRRRPGRASGGQRGDAAALQTPGHGATGRRSREDHSPRS